MRGTGFIARFLKPCAVAAFLVMLAGCGAGGSSIGASTSSGIDTDLVVADIDGDGRADVLALAAVGPAAQRTGRLQVYRQTAFGVFAAPQTTTVGRYPWQLAVGDIDGDGRQDIVVPDVDADVVWMLLQDPARPGEFRAPEALFSGVKSYSAAIADLNHDGAPDVAMAGGSGSTVRIRFQDPAARGKFAPEVRVSLPGTSANLAAGDVDGDGLVDLLVWVYTSGSAWPVTGGLVVLFQQPGGGFVDSGLLSPQTGLHADELAISNAGADGRRDLLAFLSPSSADYTARFVVVPQTAARVFGSPVSTSLAGLSVEGAAFADLNQDGVADAALNNAWGEVHQGVPESQQRVSVMLNNGAGSFAVASYIVRPSWVTLVTAGDVDGDGRNDIVFYENDQGYQMLQTASPGVFMPPRALR